MIITERIHRDRAAAEEPANLIEGGSKRKCLEYYNFFMEVTMIRFILFAMFALGAGAAFASAAKYEEDVFATSKGDLKITFIGHGTLMLTFNGKIIHVDPVGQFGDYAALPKADLILVTHDHSDHLDTAVIAKIRKASTALFISATCAEKVKDGVVLKNGDERTWEGVAVKAVPAYNIVHMRAPGSPFHPKGEGNGYVLTFGDKRLYIAGDTENIPEMAALKGVDIAFLPMNLPYTMTPEMAAAAAKVLAPKVLYPYHYGNTEPVKLVDLLKGEKGIEVRIRSLR
jgi:L-ascorbate metabolism protein UlaG (beta-lactamase superfamily)